MKLLYAVHGYKPAFRIGGPAVSVSAVAERLVRRGHEVTVVTSDLDLGERLDVPLESEVDVHGVKVWYFPTARLLSRWLPTVSGHGGGFLYAPAMARMLNERVSSMDAVHTHLPFIYPTYAAARAAFAANKPLFYHQRGVLDPQRLAFRRVKKKVYLELVEKSILNRAEMLVALTAHEVSTFRSIGVQTPCRVVPNGVELPRPELDVELRAQDKWGIAHDAKVVLFLGRIHPLKGVRLLVEAFSQACGPGTNTQLVVAGPDEDGEAARLQTRVDRLALRSSVLFPGPIDSKDKALLFARATLFCLPSVSEGFSMAVLEALASGVPVLLSPECNFREVEGARAGLVVPNEGRAWASAIEELLRDNDRLERMGKAGRDLVERQYSWDRVVDSMEETYLEGIAAWRRRA
jgi:glycosyltransferase involved in cell wall biosynthesis